MEPTTPAASEPDQPIISFTEMAIEQVTVAMKREGVSGHGLRVEVRGGGCSGMEYHLDFAKAPTSQDTVVDFGAFRVFVDPTSQQYLKGITIDYVTGLHGAGFKFLNPNATRTCGCGTSFAT